MVHANMCVQQKCDAGNAFEHDACYPHMQLHLLSLCGGNGACI